MKNKAEYFKGSYDILFTISKRPFFKRLDICIAILFFPRGYRKFILKPLKKEIKQCEQDEQ